MKIAIAQINPCIGDMRGNSHKIIAFAKRAALASADLVMFPELSLLGYPPKDLLVRKDFLAAQQGFLDDIAHESPVPVIVGAALMRDAYHLPFNAAVLCDKKATTVVGRKVLLPNYNVFDEKRYFSSPHENACQIFTHKGKKILVSICEDAWNSLVFDGMQRYDVDPIKNAIEQHGPVDVIINMSASPFTRKKPSLRAQIFSHIAKVYGVPVLMVGQVGANDQMLFDGNSLIIDANGDIVDRGAACEEDLLIFDSAKTTTCTVVANRREMSLVQQALVMGIRDYVAKCRLPGVVVGLSGGIDSAVVAALAVEALGPRNVKTAYLPTRFSSPLSYEDAYAFAAKLGMKMECFLIEDHVQGLRDLLADATAGSNNADIVDQNLQARLRGLILMALTNVNDHIMLATSNKSELAVGYATIYGDMCGALSPIGDLYKTEVYELAREMNREHTVIPETIMTRPPTAELRPDQLDSDSLPDYSELDRVLLQYIEYEKSADEIAEITKIHRGVIDGIIAMVHRSEYKRRQGPFPLMVSDKVFGDARRIPIAKRTHTP